jgi:hypothetical protein
MKINDLKESTHQQNPTYLIQERSADGKLTSRWSLMPYAEALGSNPQHLKRMLNEHAAKVGFAGHAMVFVWRGDFEEAHSEAKRKLALGKKRNDYMDNLTQANEFEKAAQVMANGDEVSEQTTEGVSKDYVNPMFTINDFLEKKKQAAARRASLAKDPDQINYATDMNPNRFDTIDESVDDYVQVNRREFNNVASGPEARLNGSTGGLYIDNKLIGYRDQGTYFLDPAYAVAMNENRKRNVRTRR